MTISKRVRLPLLVGGLVSLMAGLLLAIGQPGRVDSADTAFAYLPLSRHIYCPPYSDDFTDPTSGWFIGEDSTGQFSDYGDTEYQLWGPVENATLAARLAPTCSAENYVVETEAHIIRDTKGRYYGIIFGAVDEVTPLYSFVIFPEPHESPSLPTYALVYADPTNILNTDPLRQGPITMEPTDTITLKVIRDGVHITAYINGVEVATVDDGRILGLTKAGLIAGKDPREPSGYAAGFLSFSKEPLP